MSLSTSTFSHNTPQEECILRHRADLTLEWLNETLSKGCSCNDIADWNVGRVNALCFHFPYDNGAFIQIFYNTIFVLLILLAVAGNATVVW